MKKEQKIKKRDLYSFVFGFGLSYLVFHNWDKLEQLFLSLFR